MERDARRLEVALFLQRQLAVVAANARGAAAATFAAVPREPDEGGGGPAEKAGHETLRSGSVSVVVPSGVAELGGEELRSLLAAGFSSLSSSERAALERLLPAGVSGAELLAEGATRKAAFWRFGHPVAAFARRARLGVMQWRAVEERERTAVLARRVAEGQAAANGVSARATMAAMEEGRKMTAGERGVAYREPPEEEESVESELSVVARQHQRQHQVLQKMLAQKVRKAASRKRREMEPSEGGGLGGEGGEGGGEDGAMASVGGGGGGGIMLDPIAQAAGRSRAQKKTQSRIVNGLFLSAFNMLIRLRDILRKLQPMSQNDVVAALAQDPAVVNDQVEGMTPVQLARVAVLFAERQTRCHKTQFGSYVEAVGGDASRVHWIDDSEFDEFEVLLELESAERLLRYGLSRNIVDTNTGIISSAHVKDLKNNPVSVRRMTPEQRREFHRQEWARYENPGQAFCYRLAGQQPFCVAPQRNKTQVKSLRKHAMLVDDRPLTVTLQDVVRDALARLPQGVGTKADLQVVIMDSQFVNQDVSPNVLLSAISDSLDRLSAVSDPAASFHATSRLWSYLHRNRGLNEFGAGDE